MPRVCIWRLHLQNNKVTRVDITNFCFSHKEISCDEDSFGDVQVLSGGFITILPLQTPLQAPLRIHLRSLHLSIQGI